MLLRQLVYLRALARERPFSRAAACGISQPTLSAAVKQLETELAVPIVQRGRRFEGFTPEGLRGRMGPAHPGRLRRAAAGGRRDAPGADRASEDRRHPTALSMVPRLTTPFHPQHPDVRPTVLSQTSQQISGPSTISRSISASPISTTSRWPMSAGYPSTGSAM
ncbi:MAG TPA: LysR family transcriptional regulator, partial [Dongiaceae bacterium]